jgi:hypothetical protein
VEYRIGDRFANSHVYAKDNFLADTTTLREVRRGCGSLSHRLNLTGQNESSRLFGHKTRGLSRLGIASWLLLSESLTEDGGVTW